MPSDNIKTVECQCHICELCREAEDRIYDLPIQHQEFFNNLLDLYLSVSADLDHRKAKAKGQI